MNIKDTIIGKVDYTLNKITPTHYQVMADKVHKYDLTKKQTNWQCTCQGFKYRGKCKHIGLIKDLLPKRHPRSQFEQFIPEVNEIMSAIDVWEIVGSWRRGSPDYKDIDIICVATTAEFKDIHTRLLQDPEYKHIMEGPDIIRGYYHNEYFDINRVPDPKEWGAFLLYRTGSSFFNIAMRGKLKSSGYYLNEHGLFVGQTLLARGTEEEIFTACGMPYLEPDQREKGKCNKAISQIKPVAQLHPELAQFILSKEDKSQGRDIIETITKVTTSGTDTEKTEASESLHAWFKTHGEKLSVSLLAKYKKMLAINSKTKTVSNLLKPIVKDEETPRVEDGRTQAQLRTLAEGLEVPFEGLSNPQLELAIAKAMWEKEEPNKPFPEQISPMLIHDLTDKGREFVDKEYTSDKYTIQRKLNGMRLILLIQPDGEIHLSSRARSVKNFRFSELDDRVLGLRNIKSPFSNGAVILDGECLQPNANIILPSGVETHSTLQSTVALMHINLKQSIEMQEKYGTMMFNVFDILRLDGEDTQALPYSERAELVFTAVEKFKELNPNISLNAVPVIKDYTSAWDVFEEFIAKGEEGVILKRNTGHYRQGTRSRDQWKLKAFVTVDGFITGFTPATKGRGNEGFIGGFEISAYVDDNLQVIAGIANIKTSVREDATHHDTEGNVILNPDYLDRCLEIKGQDWNKKSVRLNSARIVEWRPDKNPEDCRILTETMRFATTV